MNSGIVYDGYSVRFMKQLERELWRARKLPERLVVIVPPIPKQNACAEVKTEKRTDAG